MADTNPQLPLHGKDVILTIFVGGRPLQQTDNATSISIDEANTQHVMKVLGRTNDFLDETPGHFELTIDLQYAGPQIVLALMAEKAKRAANQPFSDVSVGMVWFDRSGGRHSYTAGKCTTKQSWKVGGKDEVNMYNLKVQAETFKPQVIV